MTIPVFLVEDNQIIRANLIDTLGELVGMQFVGHADNAADAIDWLVHQPQAWAILIVDLFLKTGNGLAVLTACRQRDAKQRVIVLSNYATPEMRKRCAAAGADAVFDKSTEIDALIDYCLQTAQERSRG
ncbi:response regulator [Variovorax ginsengisoli]|uniref:DNA-binding NarL/FixJ family response regulator n=1 Tax=Variovorax ginsengisoli TaxID=363844 RepID=A0ABT9SCZ6_9BURK|nr:response regulator transcription factor [Variovorax ginsengisoli]MDP9901636.1 DNA-binding NarL/FixJ family response regulator [Variovorax ginsengisoli]